MASQSDKRFKVLVTSPEVPKAAIDLLKKSCDLGHTPVVVNEPVAELTIALMVAAARRFTRDVLHIENETWITWSHKWMLGYDIKGSTVGIPRSQNETTSIFVNVARGQIADQKALYNALTNHTIFCSRIRCNDTEPLPKDDPLMTLPNCVIIPHLGTATEKATENMALVAAHNVLRGLAGEPMISPAYQL
ncbi:unnamed protein product [Hermetia illucens]|uniref:D-isomer specific 2-hydroxyacid dehydrogenase NAD-binding domain-containing protein n=1 Tax=Hermetia illucens TaxID=343691 RepID=A0A7R8UFP3_HERIL|nr:unnamed protein product [Hermetia illucens]